MSYRVDPTAPEGWRLWEWVIDPILSGAVKNADASPAQLGLWHAFVVHSEVGNGGLRQVLENLDDPFIDATVAFLRELGGRHADLLVQATALRGQGPERFAALDEAWWDEEPSLDAIVDDYIRVNPGEFF